MTTTAPSPLIDAKLVPPPRRPGLVARPGLLERMDDPVARLVVASAPAGWGKTTLLAEWASRGHVPVAWVSLDAGDNDPVRFVAYLAAALRRAGAPAEPGALAMDPAGDALAEFLGDLAAAPALPAIVLDDYHAITEATVHAAVAAIVRHAPPGLRVVIGTRAEPPLGLPRLRVRGELVELRAADLRMDRDQAGAVVRSASSADLDGAALDALVRRTEGWAAGLYLAGLSLRGRGDPARFVAEFAGDDRLVVDYLAAEVLSALPGDTRRFLLRCSILARLSGPLCAAVTGADDAHAILAELEQSNLFLVPLDSRRGWYRFHHLFGELLRHQLSLEPDGSTDAVRDLHRRAAAWLRVAGDADEAVHHLAAAGDLEEAADLIAASWRAFHRHGWIATVERWLALLPDAMVRADPRLCLAAAWTAINVGRHDLAASWTDAAEAAMPAGGGPSDVRASVAMARSIERMSVGDTDAAVRAGRLAVQLEADPASQWRSVACLALGLALHHRMDQDAAYPVLAEAVEVGERTDIPITALVALCAMADIDLSRGDVSTAEAHARRALEHAEAESHARFPHASGAHAVMARVALAHGEPRRAAVHARRAVELARRGRMAPQIGHALLARARVHAHGGDAAAARADLAAVRATADREGARTPVSLAQDMREVEAAIAAIGAPVPVAAGADLTVREATVLAMLGGSGSLRDIAAELSVSPNTVKTQVRAIYRKLGVSSRADAVAAARRMGIALRP